MTPPAHLYDPFDSELCLIGAPDDSRLADELKRLLHFLEHAPEAPLQDIAYTCALRARRQPAVLAAVATSLPDLRDRLAAAHKKLTDNASRIRDKTGTYFFRDRLCPGGRVAFLFPGAVSFYPDMLNDLCLAFDDCRSAFDELEEALQTRGAAPFSPADFIFPPSAPCRSDTGPFSAQTFPEALLAVHAANTALLRLFQRLGIAPHGLAGFSGGDFSALEAAGACGDLPRQKRLAFLREGYRMLSRLADRDDLPACAMLSVIDAPRDLLDALASAHPGRIALAAFHSPRQQTVALSPDILRDVTAALHKAGVRTMTEPVDRPFNTPWCGKALPPVKQFLAHWARHPPLIPVYSCATAAPLPPQPRDIRRLTADQWTTPILFDQTVRRMHQDGFRVFVELGARGNMTTAIDETLKGQPHQTVAVNRIHRSGLVQLHHALGLLAAQGVPLDLTQLHRQRPRRPLDLDRPLSVSLRADNELRLAPGLPSLTLFAPPGELLAAPRPSPGQPRKAPLPHAADPARLDLGADFPMLTDAAILEEQPGVMMETAKTLTLDDYPFLRDYALGTSHLSYSDPSLKGLTLLPLTSSLELLCEAARKLVPRRRVAQVDNLHAQRWLGFDRGALRVILRAERIAWPDAQYAAVRVQLRDDSPNSAFTWPVVEAIVLLSSSPPSNRPVQPPPLANPRPVNWSGHDIYPGRLFHGESLRAVRRVDLWSEEGIDFELEVPTRSLAVRHTRIPLFSAWPLLLNGAVSAFPLWRSHEKFAGAISMPFRARRILFHAPSFTEGARLRGYLRLTSVTPRSHVADIQVSDGNGNLLLHLRGWEELCERVPPSYHQFILRPSEQFLTRELPPALLGNPATPVAASVATDVPFKLFENNQELWLKTLANVLLSPPEREEWHEMQGATSRRVEWLFGRAAAKEAVRRFLSKYHQARWTDADIPVWADDSGKPHPLGPWRGHTAAKLDLSITHTSKLIIAAVAANARIGIDIEALGRSLSEDFTRGVFTPEELELAAHTGDAPAAVLRFWCAKEALSKALGTGIRYSPQDLRVTSADPLSGEIRLELLGQWLEPFKHLKGRKNTVHTSLYEGHAVASCLLPASLFESE